MERLQVLCATVGQTDFSLAEAMNLQTDAVIANQNGQTRTEERSIDGRRLRMVSTSTRGTGINRSLALLHAWGDLCLLADDDVRYLDGYEAAIVNAFARYPDADVLLFNLYGDEGFVIPRAIRVRWYNFMRYPAYRIAFRRRPVLARGIRFHPLFGGSALYQAGEDTLFLRDCLQKGLRVYALPAYIAELKHERPSTWFTGYNEKFLYDRGALCAALSGPFFARLLCLRLLLVKGALRRGTGLSLPRAWAVMERGIRGYRQGLGFEDARQ